MLLHFRYPSEWICRKAIDPLSSSSSTPLPWDDFQKVIVQGDKALEQLPGPSLIWLKERSVSIIV